MAIEFFTDMTRGTGAPSVIYRTIDGCITGAVLGGALGFLVPLAAIQATYALSNRRDGFSGIMLAFTFVVGAKIGGTLGAITGLFRGIYLLNSR